MVEIITYETLYDLLRKEKVSTELQPLDKSFLEKMLNYLREKQKLLEAHGQKNAVVAIDVKKAQKEMESIKRMFRELYERREHKILTLATFASRSKMQENTSLMLPDEQRMFREIVTALDLYREGIVENILNLKPPGVELPKTIKTDPVLDTESPNKLIRFIQAVPKFIDKDLNVYGPYEPEDVANVPRKIAGILTNNKRAEEINNEIRKEAQ